MFIAGFMSAIFLPLKNEKGEKAAAVSYPFYLRDIQCQRAEAIDPDEARKCSSSFVPRG